MTDKSNTIATEKAFIENQTDPDWMDVHEAAAYLRAKVSHLRDLTYRKEIPYTKLGRLVRFHRPTLDGWMLSKQKGG